VRSALVCLTCEWYFTDADTGVMSDGDSVSLEDALGAIQPMSHDNSDIFSTPPTVQHFHSYLT